MLQRGNSKFQEQYAICSLSVRKREEIMKISITHRYFIVILSAVCLAVVCMFLTMQWSLDRGFSRYVTLLEHARFERLAEKLEETYMEIGSWDFLRNNQDNWLKFLSKTLPESESASVPEELPEPRPGQVLGKGVSTLKGTPMARFARHFEKRIVLLDAKRQPVFGVVADNTDVYFRTLLHRGQTIGYLALQPRKNLDDSSQFRLLKQQKLAFALVGLGVIIAAALFSLLLARRLVRPIGELAAATHRMASGEFSIRVPITSSDELGMLAGDFNAMALALEKNEQARRQWVADISHELRTPLAVLRGEIEAMQDGVRRCSPESIRSLHDEVIRLGGLVNDLHQLSLSDIGALSYRKEELDLGELLQQSVAFSRSEFASKDIDLKIDLPGSVPVAFFADPERLRQLFANLLDNSLKYTNGGGILAIRLTADEDMIRIDFQDSAPGVAASELPKLFDRLYRVESSRNRATGGSGLGLTICRNIVEAHDGAITARPSPLGGVWIEIVFPRTWRRL